MIRRPPRSTLFPTRRSSDLLCLAFLCCSTQHFCFPSFNILHDLLNRDRKSTRLNSSHSQISYAVFCLKKKQPYQTRCIIRLMSICTRLRRSPSIACCVSSIV